MQLKVPRIVLGFGAGLEGFPQVPVLRPLGQELSDGHRLQVPELAWELLRCQVVVEGVVHGDRGRSLVFIDDPRVHLVVVPGVVQIVAEARKHGQLDEDVVG